MHNYILLELNIHLIKNLFELLILYRLQINPSIMKTQLLRIIIMAELSLILQG